MKLDRWNTLRNQSGFTLAELTVALVVTGLIVGLAFRLHGFAHQSLVSWQDRMVLEQAGRRVITVIVDDLMMSRQLVDVGSESMVMVVVQGKVRSWSVKSHRLLRDGKDILTTDIGIEKVHLQYFDNEDNELSDSFVYSSIARVAIEITLRKGNHLFTLHSATGLRNKRDYGSRNAEPGWSQHNEEYRAPGLESNNLLTSTSRSAQ